MNNYGAILLVVVALALAAAVVLLITAPPGTGGDPPSPPRDGDPRATPGPSGAVSTVSHPPALPSGAAAAGSSAGGSEDPMDSLSSPDPEVRQRAVLQLAESEAEGVEVALRTRLLTDASPEVRAEAALALSQAKEPATITALVGALADKSEWVTDNVRVALLNVDRSLSEPALRAGIDSSDARVAYESANILENTFEVELPEDFWFRYAERPDTID